MMKNKELSSFRDPSGFIYYENNKVIRKINPIYFKEYNHLMDSGLYKELVDNNLLIKHKEIKKSNDEILLEVEKIPYISYPYEWTFEELKEAALLTLKINKIALKYGMILKDATSYNIEFIGCKPIFIDTLSFMFYEENSPWGAYGQFTRHFIAPLVLMKYVDIRMNTLLKNYIDGIPLDLCSNLLKNRGGMISKIHIKLQNKSIKKHNNDGKKDVVKINISKKSIINMFDMITNQINNLKLKKYTTEWMDYYDLSNYNEKAFNSKENIIKEFCKMIKSKDNDISFDLGSNDGRFSKLIEKELNNYVVSFDIDNNAVEYNFINNKDNDRILPLIMDFTNPSSGIGFSNNERKSFMDRGNANLTLVLAFIHHLVISNNLSFEMVADFLSKITKYLIIEFVPKEDSQVELLLKTRNDIFDFYNIETFKEEFSKYFKIIKEEKIDNSKRTLFLMEVKNERTSNK